MRRSIDFSTLTGSLSSTLKSSSSANRSFNPGNENNDTSSSGSGSSRFGTIAGMPTSTESGSNGIIRPRSALSNGTTTRRAGRGHFGLAGLFSVGQQQQSVGKSGSNNEGDKGTGGIHHSQSATDVNESANATSSHSHAVAAPHTPDTPAEREDALMQAVQAAKARDLAWEIIVVQPVHHDGLFLEYESGGSGRGRGGAGRQKVVSPSSTSASASNGTIKLKRTPTSPSDGGSSSSGNQIFGNLSGRARRFLGRAGDKYSPTLLSTTSEQGEAEASSSAATSLMTPPITPGRPQPTTGRANEQVDNEGSAIPLPSSPSSSSPPLLLTPTSPAKRRFESTEEDNDDNNDGSPQLTTKAGMQHGNAHSTPPIIITSTPAALVNVNADPNQLLVLYVTTGSSSLTLYRRLGQLIKLDDELRKHYSPHMPIAARPSILTLPLSPASLISPSERGHARRKSVLASFTRTFTSPTLSRRNTPTASSSMATSSSAAASSVTGEGERTSASMNSGNTSAIGMAHTVGGLEEKQQQLPNPISSPTQALPVLSSQLSNLSDYLTSLSCISIVRASKQWNHFFKPTREDHESSRLEPVIPSSVSKGSATTSNGRRLKRMKSDTGLQSMIRSPMSFPPATSDLINMGTPVETPDRKGVRIDDSGIGIASEGRGNGHSARDGSAGSTTATGIGRGHPTESSMDSFATSASASMKREVSTGTNTSVSAMSVFMEHTATKQDDDNQEIVGDPEVLEYMERLRQDSEARNANKNAFKPTAMGKKTEKVSKATSLDYVPPTPTSPTRAEEEEEQEKGREQEEGIPDYAKVLSGPEDQGAPAAIGPPRIRPPPQPYDESSFYSPSNEPVLAALEESLNADLDGEGEDSPLPPLSGVTAVEPEQEGEQSEAATPALTYDASPQQQNDGLLSPVSAMHDSESSPTISLKGKRKTSASSLRRRRKSSTANTSLLSHQARSRKTSIRIEDFEILRVLGKGCAGKVLLARVKDMTTISSRGGNNALYAIKAIHKHHVLAHRELAHTLTEQSILRKMVTETPNPFVVMMRWSFQDLDNLFLVLDFHPGGDLATQLSRWGRLGKDRTRFYAAEIIEGLECLHRAGVIYRDLKPENILLAADGHIVLTDFGLSKQFYRPPMSTSDSGTAVSVPHWLNNSNGTDAPRSNIPWTGKNTETTTTFCGTAEYLAPEVLLGHAYSYAVDMWSLGTMIYEMLLGVTPFYNEDHGVMYRRVLHEQLSFGPSDFVDADTRALLRGLLQKEPEFRMTTSRVKRAKYFEAIDWQFVNNKRYIPPFIPSLSPDDPADTQNFEDCFLTMDLGFVDDKDTEEIEAKAKTSGKEPDKPVDEEGRDVFADYSFDGAWADPDSEEEDIEERSAEGSDDAIAEDEEQDVASETPQEDACLSHSSPTEHVQVVPAAASDKTAAPSSSDKGNETRHHETATTATASPPANGMKADHHEQPVPPAPTSPDVMASVVEESKKEEQVKASGGTAGKSSGLNIQSNFRNSVELPRLALQGTSSAAEVVPRVSVDHEEWDLVEAMGSDEVADNGRRGPRRRLLAGSNLFGKGVVDKYKMQLNPLSRVPTPTRSYTSRGPITRLASGQLPRSAKTSNQLSPSPSIGGMSETPSSVESAEQTAVPEKKSSKGTGRRLVTPRLLRASSEWMSSSLPSSPTPRFRIKRNKKGTAPEAMTPPIEENHVQPALEPGFLPTTPKSVDSVATLPVENAGGFGLQPLTRQLSRNRGSPGSDKSRTGTSLRKEGESSSPANGDRLGPKLKAFIYPEEPHDHRNE